MSLYETLQAAGELAPDPPAERLHPTIRASRTTTAALRRIAAGLGYVLPRGAMAGDGDIPRMLEDVASGKLVIRKEEEMNFAQAITVLQNRDEDRIDEARSVVTRAVADALGLPWRGEETERLGDWIAGGEYSGSETPESIAAEWRRED